MVPAPHGRVRRQRAHRHALRRRRPPHPQRLITTNRRAEGSNCPVRAKVASARCAVPTATTASKQSLLADLANLREQNQRLRRQNTTLTTRLSEILGEEIFHASGIGHTDETETLRTQVHELEQNVLDLRQELEERTDELGAARAANRDLMATVNRHP